jgi:hypothetical protein
MQIRTAIHRPGHGKTSTARVGADAHGETVCSKLAVLWPLVVVCAHQQAVLDNSVGIDLAAQTHYTVGDRAAWLDDASISNH